jgi:hypothetical protein
MDSLGSGAENEMRGAQSDQTVTLSRGLGPRFPSDEALLSSPRIAAEHPARPIVRLVTTAHRLTQQR